MLGNLSQQFSRRISNSSSDPPPPYSSLIPPVTRIPGDDAAQPELGLEISQNADTVLISIKPPHGVIRPPVNICCVVDISGSMSAMATFRDETSGAVESDGLEILDLVKHAMKTVMSTMTDTDTLSIVTFSSDARVDLAPTQMTQNGKAEASLVIETMVTEGSTNLWGGLELGWDTIRGQGQGQQVQGQIQSMFLFTDGRPNIVPPRGHLPMIAQYLDKHGLPCAVNTFGFGYSLESDLLDQISRMTDGSFTFIPDASFVGTAFINATANLYTVMATNAKLRVMSTGVKVPGGHKTVSTTWGTEIRVGNVHYDQSRDIILQTTSPDEKLVVILDYDVPSKGKKVNEQESKTTSQDIVKLREIQHHKFRYHFIDTIERETPAIPTQTLDPISLDALTACMETSPSDRSPLTIDLLNDIQGQVREALQPEYFFRWGRHYLFSLLAAHRGQLCNNFKDPGVQHYGSGALFQALRDNFDAIFNLLPAPKPSRQGTRGGRPVDMNYYNNALGPCFHGDCIVTSGDGFKKVTDLRPGDLVLTTPGGKSAGKVAYIVKTVIPEGQADLVIFPGGLKITPYHPVLHENGEWKFPRDIYPPQRVPCDAVYSIALDSSGHDASSVVINGVSCVTLGHGVKGDVREHPYFGTELVLKDLEKAGGGSAKLICSGIIRDPVSGLVCGMVLKRESEEMPCHVKICKIGDATTSFQAEVRENDAVCR